jgi:hypothetical protein
MGDYEETLPWSSDRNFEVWSYGVGHSQLILRTLHGEEDMLHILFSGVDRMEIDRSYRGGLTISAVDKHGPYPEALRFPRFLVELATPDHKGFVVAAGIRITRRTPEDEEIELILAASKKNRTEPPQS